MATAFRTLWAAWTAFVWVTAIAVVAVAAVPHARGIGFFPQLRYALLTPACALCALGATFLYRFIQERVTRPGWALTASLLALALVVLIWMGSQGPSGLAMAAAPAVLGVAIGLSLSIPRFVDRAPRPAGVVAATLVGLLQIAGVFSALSSERTATPGATRFEVDGTFIDLPGGARIHYVDAGSGETLLFLHGNPAWSFQWHALVDGLRGSFRCVALDYPGFGLSSAPPGYGFTPGEQSRILEQFVDRLGLRDITLVMQDWGGPIGLGLAGRRPDLVRRVVLGNTWAWPTSTREARGKFSKIVGGPIGEFIQMNFNGFARAALAQGVVRKLPPDVVEAYLRPFRPVEGRGVAAFYPGQITAASAYMAEVEAGLGRIADRPALIFWGMRDRGFPRADLERFERAFPSHKTVELADANHFFFEDAAERMIEEIRVFASARDRVTRTAGPR